MPISARSPAALRWLLLVAFFTHVCTGAWVTSAAVFYASVGTLKSAPALASAAMGVSYLLSVLLSRATSMRSLRWALLLLAVGCAVESVRPWAGSIFVICGFGLLRPAFLACIGSSGTDQLRAFQLYSVVLNLGYLVGGFLVDLVRFSYGYGVLLRVLGGLAFVGLLLSLFTPAFLPPAQKETPVGRPPWWSAAPLLAVVAGFYFALAEVATVVGLIAEAETTGDTLKAGAAGGLHGVLVLIATLVFAARPTLDAVEARVVGLLLWTASFLLLALVHYPTHPSWLVLSLVGVAIGESLLGPNLMALGSRLAGWASVAYWTAAALGFWANVVYNLGWLERPRTIHFGIIAAVCAGGVLAVLLHRKQTPRLA